MRLLHAETLCFEDFFDNEIPPYAILSHRWEGKEVAFHEFEAAKKRDGPEFSKIKDFCSFVSRQPYADGSLEWVWIDTCCIDKNSSAEVSEAINSMFQWYERSEVCYAYLSSVDAGPQRTQGQQFQQSPWFTRGWTLQELIAPRNVFFLDRRWNIIGERAELAAEISAITGIEEACLNLSEGRRQFLLYKVSIAAKMSWASKRTTGRIEDMAYCMLGIFDINMPLMYGEGKKAFMRLQLEIIGKSDDESVFAWTEPNELPDPANLNFGMLAPWPTWFANCGDIKKDISFRPPYRMTNKGLEFHVPSDLREGEFNQVALNCWKKFDGGVRRATITLFRIPNKIGLRSSKDGVEFEEYTERVRELYQPNIIYIHQGGL